MIILKRRVQINLGGGGLDQKMEDSLHMLNILSEITP